MKKTATVAILALLVAPTLALACGPNDFKISNFKMAASRVGSMAKLMVTGDIANNCADPAGAKLEVQAKDENGKTIDTQSGWPLGSTNIPAGASVKFNFGALFDFNKKMKSFSAAIVSARTW